MVDAIDVFSTALIALLSAVFYSHLLTAKRDKRLAFLIVFAAQLALNLTLLFVITAPIYFKIILFFALDISLMCALYSDSFPRKLLLFALNYAISILGEMLGFSAYSFIRFAAGIGESKNLLILCIDAFIALLCVYAILLLRKGDYRLNIKESSAVAAMLLLTSVSIGSNLIFYNTIDGVDGMYTPVNTAHASQLAVGNLVSLLVINIIMLIIMRNLAKSRRIETENAVLTEQNARQLEHYEALSAYQDEIRRLRHDISNYLDTAMTLFERGDADKAREYTEGLRSRYRAMTAIDFCDNRVIDALLQNKAQLLDAKGISYDFSVTLKEDAGVDELALVCVFANLLDNAIASAALAGQDAFVRLSAKTRGGFLFVKTENSVDENAKPEKKNDGLRHGLGTDIVSRTALEHDGAFERTLNDGVCVCLCTLRCETEKAVS